MCGRYCIAPRDASAWAPIGEIFGAPIAAELGALQPQFNIAPSTQIPIIVQHPKTREFRALVVRWGLIPHWWRETKLPAMAFNARSEEAANRPLWKDAWRMTRCLIPATHWYEWRKEAAARQPYALSLGDGNVFCFAGLYAWWRPAPEAEPRLSAAILTRAAAPSIAQIHDRMPVILHASEWRAWLDPDERDPERVKRILEVSAVLDAVSWPVSLEVNSALNQSASLINPL
jgi:putative SOS response-associated peptidase YedK